MAQVVDPDAPSWPCYVCGTAMRMKQDGVPLCAQCRATAEAKKVAAESAFERAQRRDGLIDYPAEPWELDLLAMLRRGLTPSQRKLVASARAENVTLQRDPSLRETHVAVIFRLPDLDRVS